MKVLRAARPYIGLRHCVVSLALIACVIIFSHIS